MAKKSFHGTVRSQRGFLGHVQPHSLIQQLLNSSGEQKTPQNWQNKPPHRDNWSELLETSYGCWTPSKGIKARKEDEWVGFVRLWPGLGSALKTKAYRGTWRCLGKLTEDIRHSFWRLSTALGVFVCWHQTAFLRCSLWVKTAICHITRKGLSSTHWEDGERIDLHTMCVWNSHRLSLHCPSHPLESKFSQGKEGERGRERESLGLPRSNTYVV